MNIRMMEAAHDMKMPLQLICSCAQMLEMEIQPGTNTALYLKMLLESAQDLKNMVLSALDGDDEAGESVCLEMRDIVEELRRVVRFACTSAGLSTTKHGGISSVPSYEEVLSRM